MTEQNETIESVNSKKTIILIKMTLGNATNKVNVRYQEVAK